MEPKKLENPNMLLWTCDPWSVFVPPGPGAWAANGFTVIIIRRNQQKPEISRPVPPQWIFVNKLTRYQPITNCFSNKMYTHPSSPSNYAFLELGLDSMHILLLEFTSLRMLFINIRKPKGYFIVRYFLPLFIRIISPRP